MSDLPATRGKPRRHWLRSLGPGILLAATSVGASHILMSPEAGARFEYRLVWLVLLVHVLKYPAFAFAPRYVAARGESLLEAYARAPGPRHWALWMGLADMTLQAAGVLAALLGLTASFLVVTIGVLSLPAWSGVLALLVLALLAWGRYGGLRWVNLGLMALLAAGTLVAFAAAAPPLAEVPRFVVPDLPAGSLILVAAILGYMPTSIAVSIWQSLWALEHGRFRPGSAPRSLSERRALLSEGLADLRVGYGFSALLAVAFTCLGAALLAPRGLIPEGPEVAVTLSKIYTSVLGPWMEPVFLVMAFFALLSTVYASMDGFPRTFVATLQVLRRGSAPSTPSGDGQAPTGQSSQSAEQGSQSTEKGSERLYWTFLLVVTVAGMVLLASVPDPPYVIKIVGAAGLLLSPFYYSLNLWAVTRGIDDPELRPGRGIIALSLLGILTLVLTAGLLVYTLFMPAGG
ncbi:MAG: Nramp family divalent metal transporter [Acidobacteriota bacterium]